MKNKEKAQDIATQRAMLIAPLLSHGLDRGEAKIIKERICRETGLSERTIRRYVSEYREKGFTGLIPKSSQLNPAGPSRRIFWMKRSDSARKSQAEVFPRSS